jgi:hypothetical protein
MPPKKLAVVSPFTLALASDHPFNVKKLHFKHVYSKAEYIRRVQDEQSSPYVGRPFL